MSAFREREYDDMDLKEMIERAEQIRSRDRFGPVTVEEFAQAPVTEEAVTISTSHGDTSVYLLKSLEPAGDMKPLIINYHGGGFIKGRLDRDKLFCAKLVNELDCIALDVDYKLAPEYPFPAAYEESYAVLQWACEHAGELGIDTNRIALLGHSAGGNLAVGTTIQAMQRSTIVPACVAIEYPPLDLLTDPGDKPRTGRDMPPERARLYNMFYCKPEEMGDYRVSPLYTDETLLKGFPRTLVISAGEDSLAAEDEEFASKLVHAGTEVTAKRFVGSRHGFTINRVDGHDEAFELFLYFLKRAFVTG